MFTVVGGDTKIPKSARPQKLILLLFPKHSGTPDDVCSRHQLCYYIYNIYCVDVFALSVHLRPVVDLLLYIEMFMNSPDDVYEFIR